MLSEALIVVSFVIIVIIAFIPMVSFFISFSRLHSSILSFMACKKKKELNSSTPLFNSLDGSDRRFLGSVAREDFAEK